LLDANGQLIAGAPADAYVPDGSGRIKDKYNVPKPVTQSTALGASPLGDNDAIRDITQGPVNALTGLREGGIVLARDRKYWGDW
jgi:hypothetical protein